MKVRLASAYNVQNARNDYRVMFILDDPEEPEGICAYFNDTQTREEIADHLMQLAVTIADV